MNLSARVDWRRRCREIEFIEDVESCGSNAKVIPLRYVLLLVLSQILRRVFWAYRDDAASCTVET
jgi:hypothetical protein